MGLTKRKDSYYVEFRVLDDGNVLTLARGGGQLKRWKVGCLNKTAAKEHEAILKTKLLTGQIPSPGKARAQVVTFRQWATQYLALEPITRLKRVRAAGPVRQQPGSFFWGQAAGGHYARGCGEVSSPARPL
jgi:hypothetical protein